MDGKKMIWMGVFLGSLVGGYIPNLWGASIFSLSSMVWGTVGALAGLYISFRLTR